jgi:cytochrome c biogenesis protein CcmG/thiol:disulfide interchange protein DsbE
MKTTPRRLLFFIAAFIGGLGLLAALLLLFTRNRPEGGGSEFQPTANTFRATFTQPPRPTAPSPRAATPTPWMIATVDDEPINLEEWKRAVALDQVMSALVGQVPPSPEETLERLIKDRLILQRAIAASIPEADQAQVDAWLASFLARWSLDEAALEQALAHAGLTRADLLEEVVPYLLRVERALNELPPHGDAEAWVTDLRHQAKVAVLENPSALLPPNQVPPSPQPSPQSTYAVVSLPTGPRVGDVAPDFSLPATDGTTVRLSDLRGSPVLLNFWATWCSPCRKELPVLQAAYQPDTDDLVVLGINMRESPDKVATFAADLDLELPLLLDQEGQVSDAYQVRGLPLSLFVDRDGLIVARHVGPLDQVTMDSYLAPLLTAPPISSPTP